MQDAHRFLCSTLLYVCFALFDQYFDHFSVAHDCGSMQSSVPGYWPENIHVRNSVMNSFESRVVQRCSKTIGNIIPCFRICASCWQEAHRFRFLCMDCPVQRCPPTWPHKAGVRPIVQHCLGLLDIALGNSRDELVVKIKLYGTIQKIRRWCLTKRANQKLSATHRLIHTARVVLFGAVWEVESIRFLRRENSNRLWLRCHRSMIKCQSFNCSCGLSY